MKVFNPSGYKHVTVVQIPAEEIDKIDFADCPGSRMTPDAYYKQLNNKPAVIINGGFFDMTNGKPCFTFVDDGMTMAEDSAFPCGIGITTSGALAYTSNIGYRSDWRDFISAYPPLVVDGKPASVSFATEIAYKARRSMIGYNRDSIFIVAADAPGLTFEEAKKLLINIGCQYAINLDGGGSTRLLLNGELLTDRITNRPVSNVVAVYLKDNIEEDDKDVIYRVQVGAFARKESAIALKDQIASLPDLIKAGYRDAKVVLNRGLYKVQVGAFSVKGNARKVAEDLEKYGFASFITQ